MYKIHTSRTIAAQNRKHYSYLFFDKTAAYYHLYDASSDRSQSQYATSHNLLNKELNTAAIEERGGKELSPSPKKILIVDDDPDITLAFKVGLEDYRSFEVYGYTDPLEALSNFRPHFYDLLLLDINMPKMNGFELCKRILEIDVNVRICFITAYDTNIEALRELYPTLSIGCFIKKPVTIEYLAKRLNAELD
ncbi:MAG TPA: response regulator [Nitrososphaeraceae archaeon]|nr:response regulator [Nitrososphaeraceae archaeon]